MISVICGKPRGGKSYYAVMQLCYELRYSGRYIVTNLPLDLEELCVWAAKWGISAVDVNRRVRLLTDQQVFRFWLHDPEGTIEWRINIGLLELKGGVKQHEVTAPDFSRRQAPDYPGVVYFIDEGHVYFDARNTLKVAEDLSYFLSQHGHLRCDVWFISQHPKKLDLRIRLDAQEYTVCSNLGNEKGWLGVSLRGVFRRALYLNVPGGAEKPVETGTYRLDVKQYGKLYSTSAGVGLAGRVDTQENKRGRHWSRWAVALVGMGLLAWVVPVLVLKAVGSGIHHGLAGYLGAATAGGSNLVVKSSGPAAVALAPVGSQPSLTNLAGWNGRGLPPGVTLVEEPAPVIAQGVHCTGFSPEAVTLDDGRMFWANEWKFHKVRGGVMVEGLGFFPWVVVRPSGSGGVELPAETRPLGSFPRRPLRGASFPPVASAQQPL